MLCAVHPVLPASHKTYYALQEGCAAAGALGWEGHAQELGAAVPKLVEDSSALAAAIKQVTHIAVGCMHCDLLLSASGLTVVLSPHTFCPSGVDMPPLVSLLLSIHSDVVKFLWPACCTLSVPTVPWCSTKPRPPQQHW